MYVGRRSQILLTFLKTEPQDVVTVLRQGMRKRRQGCHPNFDPGPERTDVSFAEQGAPWKEWACSGLGDQEFSLDICVGSHQSGAVG